MIRRACHTASDVSLIQSATRRRRVRTKKWRLCGTASVGVPAARAGTGGVWGSTGARDVLRLAARLGVPVPPLPAVRQHSACPNSCLILQPVRNAVCWRTGRVGRNRRGMPVLARLRSNPSPVLSCLQAPAADGGEQAAQHQQQQSGRRFGHCYRSSPVSAIVLKSEATEVRITDYH